MKDDGYCGYSCGAELEKLQEIIDQVKIFSKVNPEWSIIMLGKFMQKLYDARQELSQDYYKYQEQLNK